jgi:hypothetical protein
VLTARWTNQGETLLDMGTQTTWEETCWSSGLVLSLGWGDQPEPYNHPCVMKTVANETALHWCLKEGRGGLADLPAQVWVHSSADSWARWTITGSYKYRRAEWSQSRSHNCLKMAEVTSLSLVTNAVSWRSCVQSIMAKAYSNNLATSLSLQSKMRALEDGMHVQ